MERIRRRIIEMFFVAWVIVSIVTGQTTYLEAADGSYASNPSPADGASTDGYVYLTDVYEMLEFTPGAGAVKHTGYFSDNEQDVIDRVEDANLGQPPYPQYPTRFYVGLSIAPPYLPSLVRDTWYYWCVDETDGNNVVWPGTVWSFYLRSEKALDPDPADGQTSVSITPVLSWGAGVGADEHDIYFGYTFADVNDANFWDADPEFRGTQFLADTDWQPVADGGLTLDYGTTYYWRIDESHNRVFPMDLGVIVKGDVWSFTTESDTVPGQASNPIPDDGASTDGYVYLNDVYEILEFTPGAGAVKHTGYFSDNEQDVIDRVEDANIGWPPYPTYPTRFYVGLSTTFPYLPSLVRGTWYYWCVDETDGNNVVWPGPVWSFYLKDYTAEDPDPADGQTSVSITPVLSWSPGIDAEEHDIYFGTDPNALPFIGTQFLGDEDWEPVADGGLTLDYETDYYWRINEVRGRIIPFLPGIVVTGDVWTFKTMPEISIPDPNLVSWWKFDESAGLIAYDSAGNNDAVVYGATWTIGLIDGALNFDGVDDYVDVGDPVDGSLDFGAADNLSISAWFKTTKDAPIVNKKRCTGVGGVFVEGYHVSVYQGKLFWTVEDTNTNESYMYGTAVVADDQWHHVAAVRDTATGELYLYLDGGSDATPVTDITTETLATTNSFEVGHSGSTVTPGGLYYEGTIDDVRIYDKALSAAEIHELYSGVFPHPHTGIYHVDGVNGNDNNDGSSPETAFATIQRGINVAEDGNTVLVWPGVYNEEIAFTGDAITVKSAADAAVVETNNGYAFSFLSAEGPDTVLSHFVIRNSQYGIYLVNGSSPTLRNLTIVNNDFGISAFNGADPDISNCILWGNSYGDLFRDPVPLEAKYSYIQEQMEPNLPDPNDSNEGIISHWKFDEGTGLIAYDSAGNNDGVLFGATWTTGHINGALSFDGVDDYVDIGDPVDGSLDFGAADSFSISVWIKTSQEIPEWVGIVDKRRWVSAGYGYYKEGYLLLPYQNKVSFGIEDISDNGSGINGNTIIDEGEWHHIVAVRDTISDKIYIYVDGISDATPVTDSTTGPLDTSSALNIGRLKSVDPGPAYRHFPGTLDDMRIYDKALSPQEIQQLYIPVMSNDPLFADPASGDYHLLSERGRYWPAHDVWVLDDVTSPCIDGGDPNVNPSNEPMPNGGRINMGAYGNSAYASMSEWPIAGDANRDGRFDFVDFAIFADQWLDRLPWAQ